MGDVAYDIPVTDTHTQFAQMAAEIGMQVQNFAEPAVVAIPNQYASNDASYNNPAVNISADITATQPNGHDILMACDNATLMPGVDENYDPSMQIQSPPMGSIMDIAGACQSVNNILQSQDPEPQQAPVFTASINKGAEIEGFQNNWTPPTPEFS